MRGREVVLTVSPVFRESTLWFLGVPSILGSETSGLGRCDCSLGPLPSLPPFALSLSGDFHLNFCSQIPHNGE